MAGDFYYKLLAIVIDMFQWAFLPQMDRDDPVEEEVSVCIHFRTE